MSAANAVMDWLWLHTKSSQPGFTKAKERPNEKYRARSLLESMERIVLNERTPDLLLIARQTVTKTAKSNYVSVKAS